MATWRNWSGKLKTKVQNLHFVRSEEDAAALAAAVDAQQGTLRAIGSGHSHAGLIGGEPSAGVSATESRPLTLADCSGLSGLVSVQRATEAAEATAWIWAGTPIYTLGRTLGDHGLALHNQGDIDRQTLAGAVGTGTHGTGVRLNNLSARVVGARIALVSGDIVTVDAEHNAELWQAARLNLGALGLVTQLQMQLRSTYRLQETTWETSFADFINELPARTQQHHNFECFWYPQTDAVHAKSLDETTAPAQYPLAAEGKRRAWSYEVLPNHRPHPHTEMEYSVPAADGPACFTAIRQLLQSQFTDVQWPVEYRTLAADDVWLSNAYQRDTVTISVHQDVRLDERPYYQACEAIFKDFGGRPHWGKVSYLEAADLVDMYPKLPDWQQAQQRVDPKGTCLNDYLRKLLR